MRYSLIFLVVYGFCAWAEEFDYLDPTSITSLPPAIATALANEGCKIPKWQYGFGGVTRGEFVTKGQVDTAVICVQGANNSIRIFYDGPKVCPDIIDSFGQYIDTVDEQFILTHYNAYGGNKPPPITHQGINDNIVEKASVVRYCHNGIWLELTGSD